MSSSLIFSLFNLISRLPLNVLHRLGSGLGWATYLFSSKYAARLRQNLAFGLQGQPVKEINRVLKANIAATGQSLIEMVWIWSRPLEEVLNSVQDCHGWEHVEAARAMGRGIIFLTPHLGCFEVAALYAAERIPLTVLYRPPRLKWLEEIMRSGRERGTLRLARTDIGGVRTLYKALKKGEAIAMLPDQVPGNGEGEWVNFFGQPAYTMTLVRRLSESCGATLLMACSERLSRGAGYVIRIAPLQLEPGLKFIEQMNTELESVVRTCPEQYLWSYNRYKGR